MTERRPPYSADPPITLTPLELRVQSLERDLRIACEVITALLQSEGRERCPNCGWRLKDNTDDAALDNS